MMQVFDYTEFSQDMTKAFNAALVDEVIINNRDGNSYKLLPIKKKIKIGKSPLEDIPRVKLNITTQEIVELLRECRAGI
ncbi:MAG: prevent-host-death protein [Spirochaetales bacterium]|jgi:hypothetical protein|nr:prevent-host-death protein [Spirochaetales bacterium]